MSTNRWTSAVAQNPGHSAWYIERFRKMAASGADLAGEVRFVDAMVARGSRVLDAGSGTGRVGGRLAALGHEVVGVDLDPALVAEATAQFPDAAWHQGTIADLPGVLAAAGQDAPFDAIVCAGNVLTFLADDERVPTLDGFARVLAPEGRAAVGFGAGRGYAVADFLSDARSVGLVPDQLLGTWDLRPFTEDSDFVVALLRRA